MKCQIGIIAKLLKFQRCDNDSPFKGVMRQILDRALFIILLCDQFQGSWRLHFAPRISRSDLEILWVFRIFFHQTVFIINVNISASPSIREERVRFEGSRKKPEVRKEGSEL